MVECLFAKEIHEMLDALRMTEMAGRAQTARVDIRGTFVFLVR